MSLSVVVDIGLEKRFLNAGQYLVKLIYQQEQKHPYHMINKTFKGRVHFTGNQNDKMMLAGKPTLYHCETNTLCTDFLLNVVNLIVGKDNFDPNITVYFFFSMYRAMC